MVKGNDNKIQCRLTPIMAATLLEENTAHSNLVGFCGKGDSGVPARHKSSILSNRLMGMKVQFLKTKKSESLLRTAKALFLLCKLLAMMRSASPVHDMTSHCKSFKVSTTSISMATWRTLASPASVIRNVPSQTYKL